MERALGGIERQFVKQNLRGAGNMCGIFSIEGRWPLEMLPAACAELLIRYPRLGARIKDGAFCAPPAPAAIPWQILVREDADHWRRLLQSELKRPFKEALFFITVLDGGDVSDILLSMHHSLADAMSGIPVFESLLLALGGERMTPLPASEALETRMPSRYRSWKGFFGTIWYVLRTLQRAPRELLRLAPAESPLTVNTDIASYRLDAELTACWVKALKAEDLNLFAGVCALVMLTLRSPTADSVAIGINTPVSLRAQLKPPVEADELGLFISGLLTYYRLSPQTTFYELARAVRRQVRARIKAGDPFYLGRLLGIESAERADSSTRKPGKGARLRPSFNLSNNGNVATLPKLGQARVVNLRGFTGLWPHDTLLVYMISYEGRLNIEVHASREKLGAGYAEKLARQLEAAFRRGPPPV